MEQESLKAVAVPVQIFVGFFFPNILSYLYPQRGA